MTQNKCYIAGKITGDKNYEKKFKEMEERLIKTGQIVLNPAVLPKGMDNEDYMRICFAMIGVADIVFFLDDYSESKGAMLEYQYCMYTGKRVQMNR